MQWPVPCAPPCKMCIVHSADVSSERSTKTKQRTVHNTTQMPVITASPYRLLKAILSTSGHQNTKLMTAFDWQGLFCSLAILDPRVGHTMDVLSPFISVLCHSDWLFYGESCPRLNVVHPGRAWSSSPACTWHCSLHYLFLQATPLFPHGVTVVR